MSLLLPSLPFWQQQRLVELFTIQILIITIHLQSNSSNKSLHIIQRRTKITTSRRIIWRRRIRIRVHFFQWEDVKADWEQMLGKYSSVKKSPPPSTSSISTNQSQGPSKGPFSVFDQFREAVDTAMGSNNSNDSTTPSSTSHPPPPPQENYMDMGKTLMRLVKQQVGMSLSSSSSTSSTTTSTTVQDIVTKARNMDEQGDLSDTVSLSQLLDIAQISKRQLEERLDDFLDGEELPTITPTDIFYYIEHEDERKNPSTKRRLHRFFSGIDVSEVQNLYQQSLLADLSYTDTLQGIQTSLERDFQYELAYCDMTSSPGRPSHFIAINNNNKNQQRQRGSIWTTRENDSSLEVILVVRGTKTVTDVITDLLCNSVEYRGGNCHRGILESGRYLAQKHVKLFQNLLHVSGKKNIKLTLIGHSLGAGAASIAGMELRDVPYLDIQVVGFGCPALLSENLSKQTESFITTVVADNDCIPRMSTATMLNAILDIASYDWVPHAKRDIEDAIDQIDKFLPTFLGEGYKSKFLVPILKSIDDDMLRSHKAITTKRLKPILYPPGKCIHLYRDGFGISGNEVP